MKNCVIATLSLFTVLFSKAQSYPVSAIPDSLKENADVVVRLDERISEIKSPAKVVFREHSVYTILNENALRYAEYRTFYDHFITLNYVNATLYDAQGKELQHFKKKDMRDIAAEDGYSLASDRRYREGGFSYHDYPFTVEFEEEDEADGAIFGINDWFPGAGIKISRQDSRYDIIAPKDYQIRYRSVNADLLPAISEKGDKRTYHWELKNQPAMVEEPFAVPGTAYEPYLLVGLTDIEVQGYRGNLSTWNDFGKFYGSLQKGRDVLPGNVRAKVHELVDHLSDPKEKIAVLYDYLQKNTHYVSVQLGIGGWQTFDATYVANNKYGDCKALSNFMVSLLKEAGIKANIVAIYGGERAPDFVKDFVNDPFNHVICCVPMAKDTVWLECTSQHLPAGYLSSFTSNRYGLMILDDGGHLVHTPVYGLADNLQVRNVSAFLDETGSLK
ncbi:MAG TPA: DUF3857 domain-containing protein, partial [Puia sp.]|nr:DUF3857 domain-containing protein [Puia sp.]